jgi:hypothetical protein
VANPIRSLMRSAPKIQHSNIVFQEIDDEVVIIPSPVIWVMGFRHNCLQPLVRSSKQTRVVLDIELTRVWVYRSCLDDC